MNKFTSIVTATAIALAVSASATLPSLADHYGYHYDNGGDALGAGLLGGLVGFMAGAAIASSGPSQVYVYRDYPRPDYGYRGHVRACYQAYRSYDQRSDTYIGYDGYPHQCML